MRPAVTVYIRPGCHLCEDMLEHLASLQAALGFTIETVDISHDAALESAHGTKVPVLHIDGVEIGHYFLDETALKRYFEAV